MGPLWQSGGVKRIMGPLWQSGGVKSSLAEWRCEVLRAVTGVADEEMATEHPVQ